MRYHKSGDILTWELPLDKYEPRLVYTGRKKRISDIARDNGTIHAAGGTILFKMSNGKPVQAIKTDKLHHDNLGGIVFYKSKDGQFKVYDLPPDKYMGYILWDVDWGFEVVAQLVKDGKVDVRCEPWLKGLVRTRHPRTAYGVKGNTFIVVTVDGRRYGRGMTGYELAEYMASLGCDIAIMPDGGGSSETYINGRVRNRPSDGRERPQPAALLFFEKGSEKVLDIHRLLRVGDRGPEVRELQSALHSLGHEPGPIDGIFGGLTRNAVTDFQFAHGLHVDGIVGPQTLDKLREVLK